MGLNNARRSAMCSFATAMRRTTSSSCLKARSGSLSIMRSRTNRDRDLRAGRIYGRDRSAHRPARLPDGYRQHTQSDLADPSAAGARDYGPGARVERADLTSVPGPSFETDPSRFGAHTGRIAL